jgi:acid stress-induced BolA-like protein IbaG/YrbA
MTATELQDILAQGLVCEHLQVVGDGRHWQAVIVCQAFEGLSRIQRHQQVYAAQGQRMHTDEVHALSMRTLTPAEWSSQGDSGG